MGRGRRQPGRGAGGQPLTYSLWSITHDVWSRPLEGVVINEGSSVEAELKSQIDEAVKANEKRFRHFATPVTEATLTRSVQ